MRKENILLDLTLTFMKIGLFTFGGGYAMISMIERACVEDKKWISHDEMMNITVIAESTPGPIAINCATYTGFQQAGFAGALAATFGMVAPSFGIIYLISLCLDNFLEIGIVAHAFKGIKIAVGILILDAAMTMIRKMHKRFIPRAIMLGSYAAMFLSNLFSLKFSSVSLMLIAALLSLVIFVVQGKSTPQGGQNK